jgi:hypothetical protein
VKLFNRPSLFAMTDSATCLLHDFRKTNFILQGRELPAQSRKELYENAFNTWIKWLAVAIEQPNASQVLHDSSRDRRGGGGGISNSFL